MKFKLIGSSLFLLNFFANSLQAVSVPENFKVAFLGDTGYGDNFAKTLKLIKNENVDLVLHLGDMGYQDKNALIPFLWNQKVDEILGKDFPYLFLIGNHDLFQWYNGDPLSYETILKRRLALNPEIKCVGEVGIKSYCTYKGFFFILSGIGTQGNDHEEAIEDALHQAAGHTWRFCGWHKNQADMRTGALEDAVGWEAYRICQYYGAFIGQGHEHTYARTKNLREVGNKLAEHGQFGDPQVLYLKPGQTFAFISGTGGDSLRNYLCLHEKETWWSAVFTGNYFMQNGIVKYNDCSPGDDPADVKPGGPVDFNFGVLFISFHYDHDPKLAKGEFKTIDGRVIDSFKIYSEL